MSPRYYRKSAITELPGVEDTKRRLERFLKRLDTVPTQTLRSMVPALKEEIQSETPYKTGKLEESVYVRVARDKRRPGFRLGARAHAPGTGFDYAYIQHETEDFNHPIKGKAFFVEDPFNRAAERIIDEFRDKVKYWDN